MARLTAEQFRKMFPQANNEPVTRALGRGLQAIADPLNQYRLPESTPLVGGMSAADFTGLTGAQGVLQDFSKGDLQSGDMRMFDLLGLGAGAVPVAKTALKGGGLLGKEALRQMNEGTGLLSKVTIDPRMYAVTKTDYEKAFDLAQKRAALPVSEGGLGLPANNTAMDRAKAMGFDVNNPVYHGTNKSFDAFDLSKIGSQTSMPFNFPRGVYTSPNANVAGNYGKGDGSNVMPLFINKNNPISVTDKMPSSEAFKRFNAGDADTFLSSNVAVARNPNQLRSRFAAFDPFRRNEADILAGLGVGVPSINFLDKEKPKKKK
jgi:hypothetical protein